MKRKILGFIIIIVAFGLLFGINNNLNYSGIVTASNMISSSANVVTEDIYRFTVMSNLMGAGNASRRVLTYSLYDDDEHTINIYVFVLPEEYDDIEIVGITDLFDKIPDWTTYLTYYDHLPAGPTVTSPDTTRWEKLLVQVHGLSHDAPLTVIGLLFNLCSQIGVVLGWLFTFLFDTISVGIQLLRAFLFLLGIG